MVKKISENQFDQVTSAKKAVVDFSATWCGPCKMLAPVMDGLSDEMNDISFFNIDVDECPNLAEKFRIMNIPAVIAFKDGEPVGTQVGFVPAESMKDFLNKSF